LEHKWVYQCKIELKTFAGEPVVFSFGPKAAHVMRGNVAVVLEAESVTCEALSIFSRYEMIMKTTQYVVAQG
jgi:hypothetical protein